MSKYPDLYPDNNDDANTKEQDNNNTVSDKTTGEETKS